MFVTFHRAVCRMGSRLNWTSTSALTIGTTGLATKVDHGYLQAFAAAAAVGGLGVLRRSATTAASLRLRRRYEMESQSSPRLRASRYSITSDRLPVITLKEGSRARVYIGTDILIPSYAEHRVDPTL